MSRPADPVGIGIIGCGYISAAYLTAARCFPILDVRAVADLNPAAAEACSAEFGVPATSVEALLHDPAVEIVVNLTVPDAHVEVGLNAVAAGKHVYSEKPLGTDVARAQRLVAAAEAAGVRIGCAPDTFLGGAQQTCRRLLDGGAIGHPVAGTAFWMGPGHERWHPNPDFYYARGGGPMLDMGPYYLTALVNLLGPVRRVAGLTSRVRDTRRVGSGPRRGASIPVEVPTHVAGTLEFVSGVLITIVMSFDVAAHRHGPLELYGTGGALLVPDPNRFAGRIELATAGGDWQPAPMEHGYADGDHRIIGVADLAHALRAGRPHRASGALALHVLEVLEAFQASSVTGAHVEITSWAERPAGLPSDQPGGVLD